MAIDIEAPGANEAALITALRALVERTPVLLGTIDLSVNNATSTEGASRQITGLADYKEVFVTITGLNPADSDILRMRMMESGASVGATGIWYGTQQFSVTAAGLYGFAASDNINMSTSGTVHAHATITGHDNAVTPTKVTTVATDDSGAGSAEFVRIDYMSIVSTVVLDGLSFLTTAGTVIQGTIKAYGVR